MGGQPPGVFGRPNERGHLVCRGAVLEVFNFNELRVGGDTWFDSVLREMAGIDAIAGMRAKIYLMKSM
jgi:hypothetical protein